MWMGDDEDVEHLNNTLLMVEAQRKDALDQKDGEEDPTESLVEDDQELFSYFGTQEDENDLWSQHLVYVGTPGGPGKMLSSTLLEEDDKEEPRLDN